MAPSEEVQYILQADALARGTHEGGKELAQGDLQCGHRRDDLQGSCGVCQQHLQSIEAAYAEGSAFLVDWVRELPLAEAVAGALLDPLKAAVSHPLPTAQDLMRAIARSRGGAQAMQRLLEKGGLLRRVAEELWDKAKQLEAELADPPPQAPTSWVGVWAREGHPSIQVAKIEPDPDSGDGDPTFRICWVNKENLIAKVEEARDDSFTTKGEKGETFRAHFENGKLIWEGDKEVWVPKQDEAPQARDPFAEPPSPRFLCGHRPSDRKKDCKVCYGAKAESYAQEEEERYVLRKLEIDKKLQLLEKYVEEKRELERELEQLKARARARATGAPPEPPPASEAEDPKGLVGSWEMFLKGATFKVKADEDDKNKIFHCTHEGAQVQMQKQGAWFVAEFSNMTIRERASRSGWAITYQQRMDAPAEKKALEADEAVKLRREARRGHLAAEIERQAKEVQESQRHIAELEAQIAKLKDGDAGKSELQEQVAALKAREPEAAKALADLEERKRADNEKHGVQLLEKKQELERELKGLREGDAREQEIGRELDKLDKDLQADEGARRLEELQAKDWGTCLHGVKQGKLKQDVALLTTAVAPLWNADAHAGLLPPGTKLVAAGPVMANPRGFRVVPLKPNRQVSETVSHQLTVEARYVRLLQAEETLVEEGAAKPEDKPQAQARYLQLASLLQALQGGDTVLLRGRWLVQRAAEKLALPRRQDLPKEAIWEVEELTKLLRMHEVEVVSVSYGWLTPEHPDKQGKQLQTLARALKLRLDAQIMPLVDLAVFFDWCSLHQNPRRPDQHMAFNRALKDVNLWYAHASVTVLALTKLPEGTPEDVKPYDSRGWPRFERAVSSMLKDSSRLFDLGLMSEEDKDWHALADRCKMDRRPPQHPEIFNQEIEPISFTNGSDKEFVKKKYKQTFDEVLGQATVLDFTNLGWKAEKAETLAVALKGTCDNLQTLVLDGNPIGEAGMKFLAPTLPTCKMLKEFHFTNSFIGDGGAEALAVELPKCMRLQYLQLQKTGINSVGAARIAKALPECVHLEILNLTENDIGHQPEKIRLPNGELKMVLQADGKKEVPQVTLKATDHAVEAFVSVIRVGLPLRELALLNAGLNEVQKDDLRDAWKAAFKKPENLRLIL